MAGPFGAMDGPFVSYQKPAEFIIMPLTRDGRENDALGGKRILQFWPQSIESSHGSNWQDKDVPGAPIPLNQWVSGGAHTVSFQVTFSRDMDGDITPGSSGFVGDGVPEDKFNVDVEAAIAWLQMLRTHSYEKIGDGTVAVAPPTLWIYAVNVNLGANSAAAAAFNHKAGGLYCTLRDVGVSRMNFFQSGRTKYANLQLSFNETMQVGGGIYPYSQADYIDLASRYTRKPS